MQILINPGPNLHRLINPLLILLMLLILLICQALPLWDFEMPILPKNAPKPTSLSNLICKSYCSYGTWVRSAILSIWAQGGGIWIHHLSLQVDSSSTFWYCRLNLVCWFPVQSSAGSVGQCTLFKNVWSRNLTYLLKKLVTIQNS